MSVLAQTFCWVEPVKEKSEMDFLISVDFTESPGDCITARNQF